MTCKLISGTVGAITRNRFAKGTLTYEGTILSDTLQNKVVLDVLQLAGLKGPDQDLPSSVRLKHGTNRNGKKIHDYLNYSSNPQSITYPYAGGTDSKLSRSFVANCGETLGSGSD